MRWTTTYSLSTSMALCLDRHFYNSNNIFSPESSTIAVINIRTPSTTTTTAPITTTKAYRPIVYPTPPRPTQAPSKLTQACPDSCIKAAKLGSCLAGCEQYIGDTCHYSLNRMSLSLCQESRRAVCPSVLTNVGGLTEITTWSQTPALASLSGSVTSSQVKYRL